MCIPRWDSRGFVDRVVERALEAVGDNPGSGPLWRRCVAFEEAQVSQEKPRDFFHEMQDATGVVSVVRSGNTSPYGRVHHARTDLKENETNRIARQNVEALEEPRSKDRTDTVRFLESK